MSLNITILAQQLLALNFPRDVVNNITDELWKDQINRDLNL